MKKVLIALSILLVLFVAAAIVLPIVLREPIMKAIKDEANKNLNATVDFADVDLSIIRSFPDLYVGITKFRIVGKGDFELDTLINLQKLVLDVDVMSAWKGSPVVNAIELIKPSVKVKILPDGRANYDIVPETAEKDQPKDVGQEGGAFNLKLDKLVVSDLRLVYDDRKERTFASIDDLDLKLKGDLGSDRTTLDIDLLVGRPVYRSGMLNIGYVRELAYEAAIDADLKNKVYKLTDNRMRVNGLNLRWDGTVGLRDKATDLDLTFSAPQTDFKELLSLIPAVYMHDFADVKTTGKLTLGGSVKGTMEGERLPSFRLAVAVDDASFKYPSLPRSVDQITFRLNVSNPGGSADGTTIDLQKLNFTIGANPVEMTALVTTPKSDPNVKAALKGRIDLGGLNDVIPFEENEKLAGVITADVALKARQSDIDAQRYNSVDAKGEFVLSGIRYTTPALKKEIDLNSAVFRFTPAFLEMVGFDAKAGATAFKANGRIDNYIGYLIQDEPLKGRLTVTSPLIDANELLGLSNAPAQPAPDAAPPAPAQGPAVVELPRNLDLALDASAAKLLYEDKVMEDVKARVSLKEGRAAIENFSLRMLGGQIGLTGSFTSDPDRHDPFDVTFDMKDVSAPVAFKTFNTVKRIAPVAEHLEGNISARFGLKGELDSKMEPVYASLNGGGGVSSKMLKMKGSKTINQVADVLKVSQLKDPSLENVNLSFRIEKGRVSVTPFDVKLGPVATTIGGSSGIDRTIDYVMATRVPRSIMGAAANQMADGLAAEASKLGVPVKLGENIDIDLLIKGTMDKPIIKPMLKGSSGGNLVDDLKKQAEEELKKKAQELENKAREEADKLKQQAMQEADRLKKEAEDRARAEADRLKKEAEAKAKAEAERLKREAEQRAKKEAEDKLKGIFGGKKK